MTRRERLEARAEKRREWAESRDRKSAAGFNRARVIADGIPFGQPILVGHHSEGRARRDQGRIHSGMSQGVESQKMAEHHRYKAANLEGALENSIFSDDPDAIEQLTEKIERLEEKRGKMKAANAEARKSKKPRPYPSYSLSNLGATIRTAKQRIQTIKAQNKAREAGEVERTTSARWEGKCPWCGGKIEKWAMVSLKEGEWGHYECASPREDPDELSA